MLRSFGGDRGALVCSVLWDSHRYSESGIDAYGPLRGSLLVSFILVVKMRVIATRLRGRSLGKWPNNSSLGCLVPSIEEDCVVLATLSITPWQRHDRLWMDPLL